MLAACAAPPRSGGTGGCDGQVQIRNLAPVAVEQLYVSPTGPTNWGRDFFATTSLLPGATQTVRVQPGDNAVRVVFVNGRAAEIAAMDVCATPILTIQPNGLLVGR
ncbi:MAG: hypothetical protein JWR10_2036 [Rubritepida sp.]|nr:hypothetical protein [Rubritepida sp.]